MGRYEQLRSTTESTVADRPPWLWVGALSVTFRCWCASQEGFDGKFHCMSASSIHILNNYDPS
eukprot:2450109-Prymnesium_polylepis.1